MSLEVARTLDYTPEVASLTAPIRDRVRSVIPDVELSLIHI